MTIQFKHQACQANAVEAVADCFVSITSDEVRCDMLNICEKLMDLVK